MTKCNEIGTEVIKEATAAGHGKDRDSAIQDLMSKLADACTVLRKSKNLTPCKDGTGCSDNQECKDVPLIQLPKLSTKEDLNVPVGNNKRWTAIYQGRLGCTCDCEAKPEVRP